MRDLGQLIIVHLVEKRSAGTVFRRSRAVWPLHITLIPWFICTDRDTLLASLHIYARTVPSFTAIVGNEAQFGPDKNVPVNGITNQAPLVRLHDDLMRLVRECGGAWQGESSAHSGVGETFRAHITHHVLDGVTHRRYMGDKEQISDFTVARLVDDHGTQMVEIIETISLKGAHDETAA